LDEYARYVDYLVEVASGAFEDDPVRALEIVQAGVKLAFHDAHKEIDELMRVLLERHKALLEAQELINTRNRELARLNDARDKFLSAVTHELRAPLTGLLVFADVLLKNRSDTLSPRDIQQIHAVQRNGRRLEMLIRDLIDVSSARSGTFKLLYARFDARAMLEEFQQSFAPVLAERQQRLELSCEEGNMAVVADRDRLIQVMSNLVANASKFSPRGTHVRVSASRAGGRLSVSVSDQGPGIPPEEAQHLFQAFHRVDNDLVRKVPGTGLGLYVCSIIVELHGGAIRLNNPPGGGTEVTWWIPDAPAQSPAEPGVGPSAAG
jgi:signal transduction histidine kinase